MRIASIVILALAVALAAFAYWGTSTPAGRSAFDEMAGIIPFAAGLLSAALTLCAAIAAWFSRRSARRHR